jgi:hypothetical protein
MAERIIVEPGQRFGRWTIKAEAPSKVSIAKNRHGNPGRKTRRRFFCVCDCGTDRVVVLSQLRFGTSKSCGCLKVEAVAAVIQTHGASDTPEYSAWLGMRTRCLGASADNKKNYADRGIIVCERWKKFENFLADMGLRPTSKHSLDRFPDNDGNYEPGNCRWAVIHEQMTNRQSTCYVEYQGEKVALATLAKRHGIPGNTLRRRLLDLGWQIESALTTPVRAIAKYQRRGK